jgi:hypothetical protein
MLEILQDAPNRIGPWGAVGLALLFSFNVAMIIFAILKDWNR